MERRRVVGALLAVGAIAVLLPLVAVASRPDGVASAARGGGDQTRLLLDVITYLLLAMALAGLLLIIWVMWPRKDDEAIQLPPRRRSSVPTLIVVAGSILLAVWLRAHHGGLAGPLAAPQGAVPLGGVPPNQLGSGVHSPPGPDWVALAIVLVIVAAAVLALWWVLRSTRRPPRRRALLAGLEEVLDDAIDDVLGEGDPRRAVVAAWARLERVLASHGVPRRDAEAPFEYAARATAELEILTVSLSRMAELYEWARFSLNDVTPAMRGEALDGLRAVRDGLRAAA